MIRSSDMFNLTDEQLACRAQAGCRRALDLLLRRFQTRLLHYLQCRGNPREVAEDLLQDTFLTVFQNLHTFNPRWRFSTWLFTIARRRAARNAVRWSVFQLPAGHDKTDVSTEQQAVEDRESRQHLWQHIRACTSEQEFTTLWMVYMEEMSLGEVALVMEKSHAAVKMMLSRLRRRLRSQLDDDGHTTNRQQAVSSNLRRAG